ncbi:MAG: class I SAM-dependent methyltransferase [Pirellulaceae bacterium]|nr:class I SAM-dependent methyltransferase [Pirellulaceae bacterium]
MLETRAGTLYDYPGYYDLVFGSDWKSEFDFLRACFARHAQRPVRHVFEPACGTGRLLYRLARAGYRASGLDLNARAVKYCNDRLRRYGLPATIRVGDMTDFRVRSPADAAFNMINSFRHLQSQGEARAHLQCMSGAVAPGGVYVIGLHLTPTVGRAMEEETWSARRGHLCVATHLRTISRDPRRRLERFRMTCDVYTPRRCFRLAEEIDFRTYTAPQFLSLVRSVPAWEIAETYDFAYRLDRPVQLQPDTEDVVFVLRKRPAKS